MIPFARRKRRNRDFRPRHAAPPPPPPPPPPVIEVLVIAVTIASATELDFEFSLPVTCDGTAAGEPIVDMPFFGWQAAQSSQQISGTVVRYAFADDQLVSGVS
jgi:hypothetical protein